MDELLKFREKLEKSINFWGKETVDIEDFTEALDLIIRAIKEQS